MLKMPFKFMNSLNDSISELDPDRIYVENIRSILKTNTRIARFICKLAVRKGYFEKYYAISCKNETCGRVIKSYQDKTEIPLELVCQMCEEDGTLVYTFATENLIVTPYYKYIQGTYELA